MTRKAALLLTILTGFTALVYQVAWQKYLAALLGSHSEAIAVVLGIFLGGLAFGYTWFGRLTRRIVSGSPESSPAPRLLRVYGFVEGAIGIYALLFPLLFLGLRAVSLRIPQGSDLVAFVIDVLLTVVLIGPPSLLMGGTIPLLTQALSRGVEDATRLHALVYGFNTAGAFLGALCGGFWLVPWLGLSGVVSVMGGLNVAAGAAFLALASRRDAGAALPPAPAGGPPPAGLWPFSTAALLIGFAMMALQTAVNRIAAFSLGSSPFTFAMVVATFVLCIALGSFAVSALRRIPPSVLVLSQWGLLVYLLLLYPQLADAPYWAHLVRSTFRDEMALFYPYYLAVFAGLLAVLALPLALAGAALPLIFHQLRREVGDLGRVAGRIYSFNTVGSLLGALLGGYALLFWLDLHHVFRLALLAIGAGAGLLTWKALPRLRAAGPLGVVVALIVVVLLPAWPTEKLTAGTFRRREPTPETYLGPELFFKGFLLRPPAGRKLVQFYDDDPAASIGVLEVGLTTGTMRAVLTNGKNDSALPGDHITTGLLGLLPALFAEKCERAFVVGYGTGLTVGELGALSTTREVVAAEISSGVIRAAPIFEPYNLNAASNPKTRIVRGDAYRTLLRQEGGYDVIASEPSNPWVTGIEQLYSLDFLQAAHERLAPGGVYSQWFHMYETDSPTLDLVFNTFRRAFPRSAVWYGTNGDILLLGFKSSEPIDLRRIAERFARPDFRAAFSRAEIRTLPGLLAREALPVGVLSELPLTDDLHTVLHPRLNHRAARAFFVGKRVSLPPAAARAAAEAGARSSLFGRLARARGGLSDAEWLEVVDQTCSFDTPRCATLYARWQFEAPDSDALRAKLSEIREQGAPADFSQRTLFLLGTLFTPNGTAELPGTFDYAERVRDVFTRYYHHAAPFAGAALHGPWLRCTNDPRCDAARNEVLSTGPLSAER